MAVASVSAAPNHKIWFFSPTIDILCLGGLSILFLLPFMLEGMYAQPALWVSHAILIGSILVNWPHYTATYYRVYRHWDEVQKYAFEAIWVPVVLIALGFASLYSTSTLAPWYCLGYLFFSGYHYSGQTYGISMIFSGKSGFQLNTWQRWCVLIPVFSAYAYPMVRSNVVGEAQKPFWDIFIPVLGFPAFLAEWTLVIFYTGLALYLGLNIYLAKTRKRTLPTIVHILVAAHIIWHSLGSMYVNFGAFTAFFHCLQYLIITSYFHFKEVSRSQTPQPIRDSIGYLRTRIFGRYYLTLILVGILMFMLVPRMIEGAGLASYTLSMAIVISFINMHHFILDGAIWKLRKPEVGQPLMS